MQRQLILFISGGFVKFCNSTFASLWHLLFANPFSITSINIRYLRALFVCEVSPTLLLVFLQAGSKLAILEGLSIFLIEREPPFAFCKTFYTDFKDITVIFFLVWFSF